MDHIPKIYVLKELWREQVAIFNALTKGKSPRPPIFTLIITLNDDLGVLH